MTTRQGPRFTIKRRAYERHADELEPFVLEWRRNHSGKDPTFAEIIAKSEIVGLCNTQAVGIAWRELLNRWAETPDESRQRTGGKT